MIKRILLFVFTLAITVQACNSTASTPTTISTAIPTIAITPSPSSTVIPTVAITPSPTPTVTFNPTIAPSPFPGTSVSFGRIALVLPLGLASGASGTQFPRATGDSIFPPEVTPGHTQLTLDGYALQNKFHQPKIYVYPADEYAQLQPSAAESIKRLRGVLAKPNGTWTNEVLPTVPFFNAAQVFASNIKVIAFQNGQGVRILTEYAQYAAPVNNQDLFYHFEGLTSDEKYYVIAILPITATSLPVNAQPNAVIPTGGVPLPNINDSNADWPDYYRRVVSNLDNTKPDAFLPNLDQLDTLIKSIRILPTTP